MKNNRYIVLAMALTMAVSCLSGCNNDKQEQNNSADQSVSDSSEVSSEKQSESISESEKDTVFNLGERKYYISGAAVFDITDADSPKYLRISDPQTLDDGVEKTGTPHLFNMNMYKMLRNGNEVIGNNFDEPYIFKWKIEENNDVKKTILYDHSLWTQTIKEKIKEYPSVTDDPEIISDEMMVNSQSYTDAGDGYIYFIYFPAIEHLSAQLGLLFSVGRFAKDGSGMEFLDDIRAGSIAASGGYLYYLDNGFKMKDKKTGGIDSDRVGIYRIKPDGSEKKKLALVYSQKDNYKDDPVQAASHTGGRLEISGENLYYLAADEKGETYLYRMPLEGGDPVKLTKSPCADYYVDEENKTIYFQKGTMKKSSPEGCSVYSMPLDGGDETELFNKLEVPTYGFWADVDGDYLYLSNYNRFVNYVEEADASSYRSGQRFNLKTKEMEKLSCTAKGELKSVDDIEIKWIKEDNKAE